MNYPFLRDIAKMPRLLGKSFQWIGLPSAVLLACWSLAPAAVTYTLTDIGAGNPVNPSLNSFAYGINSAGQVVGEFYTTRGWNPFVWDSVRGMQDLGLLPQAINGFSTATAINDSGHVVGSNQTATGYVSFEWDSVNGLQSLGQAPGYDINSAGQIAGSTPTPAGQHAAILDHGTVTDMGTLPGAYSDDSRAFAVNDAGQAVGSSSISTSHQEAFIWDSVNDMRGLGFLNGDDWSAAYDVNNQGQVVGISQGGTSQTSSQQAFLWDSVHDMQGLGYLPGDSFSLARAINDSGQVVGYSSVTYTPRPTTDDGGAKAFIWDSAGGLQNLNDLLDVTGAGWRIMDATAINSAGQIVGYGLDPTGRAIHAILLTPHSDATLPESSSLLVWSGLSIACAIYISRRRLRADAVQLVEVAGIFRQKSRGHNSLESMDKETRVNYPAVE